MVAGAEEKKNISSAKTVSDWVEAYYGFDGLDHSKKNKIKHIHHTAQFGSIAYIITKNSKQAHTDLFESNYTTLTNKVADAAELILKLIHIKFSENRPLTAGDFIANEGSLFAGVPNHDKIIEDYIGADGNGGLVARCQTCLPIYTDNSKTAANVKEILGDIGNTRLDHERLLANTGAKGAALNQEELFAMISKASECASKIWKEQKDAKSEAEKKLMKDTEDAFYKRDDLALKTGKLAVVAGGSAACIGAVVAGVFWPAILLIPAWHIGKNWAKDWAKAAGAMWKNRKDVFKDKRDRDRAIAAQHYIMDWAKTGGKPRLSLKDSLLLRGADKAILKKQAKQVADALDIEDLQGNMMYSKGTQVQQAMAKGLGNLTNPTDTTKLAPADAIGNVLAKLGTLVELDEKGELKRDSSGKIIINTAEATMDNIKDFISKYKSMEQFLPDDAKDRIHDLFRECSVDVFEHVLFHTKMEDAVYVSVMKDNLSNDSEIMKFVLDGGKTVESMKVQNYATFASKELTKLAEDPIDTSLTLAEYINKPQKKKFDFDLATGKLVDTDSGYVAVDTSIYHVYDPVGFRGVLSDIANIKMGSGNDKNEFFHSGMKNIPTIVQEISKLEVLDAIGDIDEGATQKLRNKVNQVLDNQIDRIRRLKLQEYSQTTFDALEHRFNGKLGASDMAEAFKKIGEITFDTVNTISQLYTDIGKYEPKEASDYIRYKLRKQVFDLFKAYSDNNVNGAFQKDLPKLAEYLKKVNTSPYLDDGQKRNLTSAVSPCLASAFGEDYKNLTQTFMTNYSQDKYINYLQSYENGGFDELFASDQSAETQELKNSFIYMRDLQNVFNALKFNDQFDLNKDEARYISTGILTDMSGDPPERITRDNNDSLRNFITSRINNMSMSYTGKIEPNTIESIQAYKELEMALNEIKGWSSSTGSRPTKADYDKYTALVILKNKCVASFRLCVKSYIQTHSRGSSSRSSWIDDNIESFYDVIKVWEEGIMKDIDEEMDKAEYDWLVKPAGKTARSELTKYGTGPETESMFSEKQL